MYWGEGVLWGSLVAQTVKNLPVMQETQVQSLDKEVPLEKGMAIHSSIPAWRTAWTEEPGGLQSTGLQSGTQLSDKHFSGTNIYRVAGTGAGEGNGTPLQYLCLENPVDGGAWRAAVHRVAQSRTRMK